LKQATPGGDVLDEKNIARATSNCNKKTHLDAIDSSSQETPSEPLYRGETLIKKIFQKGDRLLDVLRSQNPRGGIPTDKDYDWNYFFLISQSTANSKQLSRKLNPDRTSSPGLWTWAPNQHLFHYQLLLKDQPKESMKLKRFIFSGHSIKLKKGLTHKLVPSNEGPTSEITDKISKGKRSFWVYDYHQWLLFWNNDQN